MLKVKRIEGFELNGHLFAIQEDKKKLGLEPENVKVCYVQYHGSQMYEYRDLYYDSSPTYSCNYFPFKNVRCERAFYVFPGNEYTLWQLIADICARSVSCSKFTQECLVEAKKFWLNVDNGIGHFTYGKLSVDAYLLDVKLLEDEEALSTLMVIHH